MAGKEGWLQDGTPEAATRTDLRVPGSSEKGTSLMCDCLMCDCLTCDCLMCDCLMCEGLMCVGVSHPGSGDVDGLEGARIVREGAVRRDQHHQLPPATHSLGLVFKAHRL